MVTRLAWIVLIALTGLPGFGAAWAQEPFYAGKTVRIVVGTSPGGGFDTYSRTIARHLGKHIPGSPTVIVENMAGAGGFIAANYMYRVARPDGVTLSTFVGSLLLSKLYDRPGAEFDALKFEYVGQPARTSPSCTFARKSGITSLETWMASKTPVKLGGVGAGTEFDDAAKILAVTLGLPIQLVTGYESGDAVVVLQITPRPHPDLPKVPVAITLVRTEEARQLLEAGIHAPSTIYRPYLAPPGTPKDRVQLLRRAFQATLRDPDFVAEARRRA